MMIGIRDFDMPSCCNSCEHWRFNRDDEPLCDLTYEYIRQFDKRQDNCPLVEAIPKDKIQETIDEVEKYICDVETDTVKAQGMAQALEIFEQALGGLEYGNK